MKKSTQNGAFYDIKSAPWISSQIQIYDFGHYEGKEELRICYVI